MRRPLARLLLAALCLSSPLALAATPPKQPEKGPGGADYTAAQVVKRAVGTASAATYVFHPNGPAGQARPVVVFFHSWGGANPQFYGGWIEHLARKGFLVLFPRFQEVNRTRPADATGLATTLVRDAFASLANDPDARPDPSRVAYVGHLAGSIVALNVAASAKIEGFPVPKLVFAVMPGGIAQDAKSRGIPLGDLSQIDASTIFITMSGDRDHLATDRNARRLLKEVANVPANRKLFMRALSDDHGFPTLSATLASPGSPKDAYDASAIRLPADPPLDPKQQTRFKWSADMALTGQQTVLTAQLGMNVTDSLDYYAFWKTLDVAAEAAFAGRDAVTLPADPRFIDMGSWSDGWPVRRLSADMPRVEGETKPQQAPGRRS